MNLVLDTIARKALSKDLQLAMAAASLIIGMPPSKLSFTWRDIAKKAISLGAYPEAEHAIAQIKPEQCAQSDPMWRALAVAYGRSGQEAKSLAAAGHITNHESQESVLGLLGTLKVSNPTPSAAAVVAHNTHHHTTRARGSPRS